VFYMVKGGVWNFDVVDEVCLYECYGICIGG